MRPGDPRRWILITREKGIAETPDAGARWSIDHLIVDQDAVPTLVEVKRGSNPEIRRTIVGQMLEYAAHAAQTWTADELRRTFEESANAQSLDPSEVLGQLLQAGEEPDADGFWEKVATNLTARRLRLLFVADDIPDPLERVVEFLNAQMPGIEVLAVEIKQFRGRSTQTLVPRVLGRTATSSGHGATGPRRRLTQESFLDELPSDEARNVATRILDVAREHGASLAWVRDMSAFGCAAQSGRNPSASLGYACRPQYSGQPYLATFLRLEKSCAPHSNDGRTNSPAMTSLGTLRALRVKSGRLTMPPPRSILTCWCTDWSMCFPI